MVRKLATTLVLSASMFGLPAIGMMGCDREVAHKETVTDGPGGTKVKEESVVKKADGTVEKKTESKTVNNP